MKKILFATDAAKMDKQSLDFACYICALTGSKLTGIFLENLELETRSAAMIEELAVDAAGYSIPAETSVKQLKDDRCEKNIRIFREICTAKGIYCKVHRNRGVPLQEVIDESRYADLIVADMSTSFSAQKESVPTRFIKEIAAAAECPVVAAPVGFEGIEEIVFAFDGSRSAAFAIKQFTYLFPELHNRKACILHVATPGKTIGNSKLKLKEWLQAHYSSTEIVTLEDEHVSARLLEFLLGKKQAFIVMGAFGRGRLSGMFNPSHATPVMKMVTEPVFITHC